MSAARTGGDAIVSGLADLGVSVCFANPGTSEMHLLAALDREPRIRSVLCLFEGVATGAADGFARMAGVPAMTLLHLGPGYANGAANVHNAKRAFSPMINVVGDHATSHADCDAPLASDIATQASTSSVSVVTVESSDTIDRAVRTAFDASVAEKRGPVALLVPADCAWSESRPSSSEQDELLSPERPTPQVSQAVDALRAARRPALLLGGGATEHDASLAAAARLAAIGVTVYADTFVARQRRGGSRFEPRRLPYFSEAAVEMLSQHDLLVLAGTSSPVGFFAYPGVPSRLVPDRVTTVTLCSREADAVAALEALADVMQAEVSEPASAGADGRSEMPQGVLTPATVGASLARHMPADAIVSDDAVTSSGPVFVATATAREHDWLSLTGGAIGQGLPLSVGAAIARPGSRVVALTGDGAAMYTVQALWTMVREALDVTIVVFANDAYRILDIEFQRTGAGEPGERAAALLSLSRPTIDWCALARSMGVDSERCEHAEMFDHALRRAFATKGPFLIEARIE